MEDPSHVRQSRFSKANTFISQLCKKVKKEKQSKKVVEKKKQIQKVESKNTRGKVDKPRRGKEKEEKDKNLGSMNGLNFSTNAPSLIPTPI